MLAAITSPLTNGIVILIFNFPVPNCSPKSFLSRASSVLAQLPWKQNSRPKIQCKWSTWKWIPQNRTWGKKKKKNQRVKRKALWLLSCAMGTWCHWNLQRCIGCLATLSARSLGIRNLFYLMDFCIPLVDGCFQVCSLRAVGGSLETDLGQEVVSPQSCSSCINLHFHGTTAKISNGQRVYDNRYVKLYMLLVFQ